MLILACVYPDVKKQGEYLQPLLLNNLQLPENNMVTVRCTVVKLFGSYIAKYSLILFTVNYIR